MKQETETIPKASSPFNICNISDEGNSSTNSPFALVSANVQQLDEQIKSMMDISENMTTDGRQKARICKVCGKEGWRRNIMTHIEANHIISDVSHPCDICGKISRSRHGLRLHKANMHCKWKYLQDQRRLKKTQSQRPLKSAGLKMFLGCTRASFTQAKYNLKKRVSQWKTIIKIALSNTQRAAPSAGSTCSRVKWPKGSRRS